MSRIGARTPRFIHVCTLCKLPYPCCYRNSRFCSARCRQRWHRGHRSTDTIQRAARGYYYGHLSDRIDEDFAN